MKTKFEMWDWINEDKVIQMVNTIEIEKDYPELASKIVQLNKQRLFFLMYAQIEKERNQALKDFVDYCQNNELEIETGFISVTKECLMRNIKFVAKELEAKDD